MPSTRTLSIRSSVVKVLSRSVAPLALADWVLICAPRPTWTSAPNSVSVLPMVVVALKAEMVAPPAEVDRSVSRSAEYLRLLTRFSASIKTVSASTLAPAPITTSALPDSVLITRAPLPANWPTARFSEVASKS